MLVYMASKVVGGSVQASFDNCRLSYEIFAPRKTLEYWHIRNRVGIRSIPFVGFGRKQSEMTSVLYIYRLCARATPLRRAGAGD